jgi:hypothetical protein
LAILDGDVSNPYLLNDYHQTNLDDYKWQSEVSIKGYSSWSTNHNFFKAWDVYNNPVIAEIQFVVMGDEDITLTHVINHPNPFVNYTEFWFHQGHMTFDGPGS